MQPESTPSFPQTTPPAPTPQPASPRSKAKRNINYLAIVEAVFLCVFLVGLLGLGFWAYQLNDDLTISRQDYADLQKEHAQLQSDYEKQTADLEQTKSVLEQTQDDLEKTKTDLATAQADLEKSGKEKDALQTKIETAKKFVDVAVAFFVNNNSAAVMKTKIKLTGDDTLLELFTTFEEKEDLPSYIDFIEYLIDAIASKLE